MEPRDLFFFEKMLTPKIITFIYWVLLVVCVIGGVIYMFQGNFFVGLFGTLGGLVAIRIWCELAIVFFKMNEALQAIRGR